MHTLFITGIAALALAGDLRPMAEAFVEPDFAFNGINRPLMVQVTSPRRFGDMALTVMDADGRTLAEPVEVEEGHLDLAQLFPELWSWRATCYVQLLKRGEPDGSALVLVPMLSRMVPVTSREPHPAYGSMHTKIVGWRDEFAPEPEPEPDAGAEDAAQPAPTPPERFFTGYRAYVERDVVLHTSLGDIRLAMRPDHAPNTVRNFLDLCRDGFYRDVIFHRIVPMTRDGDPFVIQAGDPTGVGDGGPGYWLPIEPSALPHDFGVISMARDDNPDTAGSQFFICLSRAGTARLDVQYCSFGYAVTGAETIVAIAQVELADVAAGRPANPPVIHHAELVPAPPRTPGTGRTDGRVQTPMFTPRKPGRVPR
jgi:peptidyl-prolyl cis-trans isomerase B (cyclophilin B)